MMAAAVIAVSLSAQEFKVDLDSEAPWKKIDNYNKRLKIEVTDIKGKKAVMVSYAKKDNNIDTAFVMIAPDYVAEGKKAITVKFQVLASPDLRYFNGKGDNYVSGIRWYDAAGKEIKPMTRFNLPHGSGEFQTFSQEVTVPPVAKIASLQIGFDNPNIADGQIFAVSDIQITE